MPPLKNARHELAVQYRIAGHSQVDAYAMAGYSGKGTGSPSALFARDDVQARLCELQDHMAERLIERRAITMETLTEDMQANRRLALELKQMSVAQTASRDLAKMHGFMNDKSVHLHKSIDDMNEAELVALLGDTDGNCDTPGKSETTDQVPGSSKGPSKGPSKAA